MNREEFENLNPQEQERIFHQTPFRDRGDLLLHSHDPVRLARSLSQEELYLLTREMDLEERTEVIRYATLPQLFFISDIDCWKKDRLNPQGFLRWLETLALADEARLLAWLVEMDYETIVSSFKGLIRVLKPEWEYPSDELLGDQPYFTLDERYFILVSEENLETVRRAIEILFENTRGRYTAVLEGVMGELDYEMEEEAFQNRARRLTDRGFPVLERARQIYRPLSLEEYEQFSKKNGRIQTPEDSPSSDQKAPHYLVLRSPDRLFLDEVLLHFRGESFSFIEGLEEELAWLSNKVLACEGIDFASEDRVRQGVERARRFVNLGLESLSERDLARACELVRERWLEMVFRWGVTKLVGLRDRAWETVQSYWAGSRKSFLEFLGSPYEVIFRGLFQIVPQCFDPEVQELDSLRDFKDLQDLERTRRATLQVQSIHACLASKFPNLFHRLNLEARRGLPPVSLFPLLGTIFAHTMVRGELSTHPLSEKEVQQFLQKGFEAQASQRILKKEWKENFLSEFLPRTTESPVCKGGDESRTFSKVRDKPVVRGLSTDGDAVKPVWALAFQRLEEEFGTLDPSQRLDPRFISSLYFSPHPSPLPLRGRGEGEGLKK